MTLQQITANDIAGWDSLDDIASSFEKRGLKPRDNLGDENELVLQLTDTEFIVIVEAGPGESATDFKPSHGIGCPRHGREIGGGCRGRRWHGLPHGTVGDGRRVDHAPVST